MFEALGPFVAFLRVCEALQFTRIARITSLASSVHMGLVNGGDRSPPHPPPPLNDGDTWNTILRSSSSEFPFDLVLVDLGFHLILYCWSFLLRFGTELSFDFVLVDLSFHLM